MNNVREFFAMFGYLSNLAIFFMTFLLMVFVSFYRKSKKTKKRIVLPVQSTDNWRGIDYCKENFKALNTKSILLFVPTLKMSWFDWVFVVAITYLAIISIYENWPAILQNFRSFFHIRSTPKIETNTKIATTVINGGGEVPISVEENQEVFDDHPYVANRNGGEEEKG